MASGSYLLLGLELLIAAGARVSTATIRTCSAWTAASITLRTVTNPNAASVSFFVLLPLELLAVDQRVGMKRVPRKPEIALFHDFRTRIKVQERDNSGRVSFNANPHACNPVFESA